MIDRVGQQSWKLRSAAEERLAAQSEAQSVQLCKDCGKFYLSVLMTPSPSGSCGCPAKFSHTRTRPTADWKYHGAHRDGEI